MRLSEAGATDESSKRAPSPVSCVPKYWKLRNAEVIRDYARLPRGVSSVRCLVMAPLDNIESRFSAKIGAQLQAHVNREQTTGGSFLPRESLRHHREMRCNVYDSRRSPLHAAPILLGHD